MNETELAQFRQQHLGFIFQSYNLLPTMTAAENVALPLMFKGIDKKTRLKLARKELKSMGLLGRANHLPTEMSGGQQQRVGIARAFVSNPKVIFADEPTGNLDSKTSKQVLYRMLELTKNQQVTFVMVTHEPELAECADRVVTILDGKVCSNVVQDEATKTATVKDCLPTCRAICPSEATRQKKKVTNIWRFYLETLIFSVDGTYAGGSALPACLGGRQ